MFDLRARIDRAQCRRRSVVHIQAFLDASADGIREQARELITQLSIDADVLKVFGHKEKKGPRQWRKTSGRGAGERKPRRGPAHPRKIKRVESLLILGDVREIEAEVRADQLQVIRRFDL